MPGERAQPSDSEGLPSLPALGEVLEGRYHLDAELGRGGMGVVLAAHDEKLGRRVAIKLLMPRLMRSPEAVTRFSHEAQSLARLESPHVVRVLDYGLLSTPTECCGLPFMVLELLHGDDLFSVVSRDGALSPSRVVRYALEACAGLAAAHAQGIVHRDLKPENLFLAVEQDGSECIKVLDFGIARSRTRQALTKGHGVGSPGYMSPEQVEGGQNVDARADIWALGVVMYELLARRPAFIGDSAQSLCLQILTAPVTPLAELRPDLPKALVYVVERCMERDPARRFANVAELAEALSPLDDYNQITEADRIRHRLASADDEVDSQIRPRAEPRSADDGSIDVVVTGETPSRNRRRVLSALVAGAILVPAVALLPKVMHAPELEPARAWSFQAVQRTQETYSKVRERAKELWMKEPAGKPVPGEQP